MGSLFRNCPVRIRAFAHVDPYPKEMSLTSGMRSVPRFTQVEVPEPCNFAMREVSGGQADAVYWTFENTVANVFHNDTVRPESFWTRVGKNERSCGLEMGRF